MASAISGLNLNAPLDPAARAMLRATLVLCIRDQQLQPVAFRDAMTIFGAPVVRTQLKQHPDCREVNVISSEDRDDLGDGKRLVNGAHWHTDDSFMCEPCALTMLYGVEVPSTGGDTQFTNMYLAYADLPDDLKRVIDGLKVVHRYNSSRKGTRVAKLSRPPWRRCRMRSTPWFARIRKRDAGPSTLIPIAWNRLLGSSARTATPCSIN